LSQWGQTFKTFIIWFGHPNLALLSIILSIQKVLQQLPPIRNALYYLGSNKGYFSARLSQNNSYYENIKVLKA